MLLEVEDGQMAEACRAYPFRPNERGEPRNVQNTFVHARLYEIPGAVGVAEDDAGGESRSELSDKFVVAREATTGFRQAYNAETLVAAVTGNGANGCSGLNTEQVGGADNATGAAANPFAASRRASLAAQCEQRQAHVATFGLQAALANDHLRFMIYAERPRKIKRPRSGRTRALYDMQKAMLDLDAPLTDAIKLTLNLPNTYQAFGAAVLFNKYAFRQSMHTDEEPEDAVDGHLVSYLVAFGEACYLNVWSARDSKLWRMHIPQGHVFVWRGDVPHCGASTPTVQAEAFERLFKADVKLARGLTSDRQLYNEARAWCKNVFDHEGVDDARGHGYISETHRWFRAAKADSAWEGGGRVEGCGELDTAGGLPCWPY